MSDDLRSQAEQKMSALEAWMAPLFSKAPHMPASARETLAGIAPWLALIFGILGLLGVVSALSAASFVMPYAMMYAGLHASWYPPMVFGLVLAGIASLLELFAFKPLQSRKKKGWSFLFYGLVLSTIGTLVQVVFGYSSLASVIFLLIGFWLLFEIRGLYR